MSERITRTWQMIPEFVKSLNESGEIVLKVKDNMSFPKLVTMNLDKRIVDGTTAPAVFIKEDPNPAGQYIIRANSQFYDERCKAMERYAAETYKGKLSEITEKKFTEGELPDDLKPKLADSPEVAILKKQLEEAQAELKKIKSKKE